MLPVYEIRKSDLTIKQNDYELSFGEHMHKYIEIVYVKKGRQRIKIERTEYELGEGCAAVIFPDTLHAYFSDGDTRGSDIRIIMASPRLFGNLFPDLSAMRPDAPVIDAGRINDELRFALNAAKPGLSGNIRFSWVCVIMSYILNIIRLETRFPDPISDLTYKITKYIEKNFMYDISRKTIADEFNVSECYISKIFSDRFKMNLRNYLGALRSEYAAGLIRTTNKTFTEISQDAGFGSLRTFNRMFRMHYGMAPNEYKRNIVKLNNI